jgi:uncharacterized membrane protein (Fun14 family)
MRWGLIVGAVLVGLACYRIISSLLVILALIRVKIASITSMAHSGVPDVKCAQLL